MPFACEKIAFPLHRRKAYQDDGYLVENACVLWGKRLQPLQPASSLRPIH